MEHYNWPKPAVQLSYERCAYTYFDAADQLRLTVDHAIYYSEGSWFAGTATHKNIPDLELRNKNNKYHSLLPLGSCLMEIKCGGVLPLKLSRAFAKLDIYPQSFSKVGRAHMAMIGK